MKKYLAFGVNIGNLGRSKRRMGMKEWTQEINVGLARREIPLKITAWYGHTGNFALEAATLERAEVQETICESLGTGAAVFSTTEVREYCDWLNNSPSHAGSSTVRATPGLIFLVKGP